jgi:hypothetical protein
MAAGSRDSGKAVGKMRWSKCPRQESRGFSVQGLPTRVCWSAGWKGALVGARFARGWADFRGRKTRQLAHADSL